MPAKVALESAFIIKPYGPVSLTEINSIKATRTDYIIVPEDYDGLLLYVYVGEWTLSEPTERTHSKVPVNLLPIGPFNDEENIDDYVFFGITKSK